MSADPYADRLRLKRAARVRVRRLARQIRARCQAAGCALLEEHVCHELPLPPYRAVSP